MPNTHYTTPSRTSDEINNLLGSVYPATKPTSDDWLNTPLEAPKPTHTKPITPSPRPGFDRFCPAFTRVFPKKGPKEGVKIPHGYDSCDCSDEVVLWIPILPMKEVGKPNQLKVHVEKQGLETGIDFPEPVLKPRNRKSKKQKEKSKSHQFTIKDSAFPSMTEDIFPVTEATWKKKQRFSRLSIIPEDLVKEEEPDMMPLTTENLTKFSDLKSMLEQNWYYEDNGILDPPEAVEEVKDQMDTFSAAGSTIMKMLPDRIVQQLGVLETDPLEVITCLIGVAGYITTLASMQKQTNNAGVKVGMTLMTMDYLHRIYTFCSKSSKVKETFEKLSSDLTAKMSGLEKQDEENFEFNLKIAKTISSLGCFLLSCFGISPAKQMNDFIAYKKASDETFDIMTVLLWECLEIDIKGDKLLAAQVKTITDEGAQFENMLSQDLFGKNMVAAEAWVDKAIKLDRALGKSTDMRLKALIGKITNLISETRKADGGSLPIPTPACIALHGKPGRGKSNFMKFVFKQLANYFNTDDRMYDLNSGRHFAHYSSEQWGYYDEFGAAKEMGENSIMPIMNQILSGNSANIPGAAVEDKHQYSKFTGVCLISNKAPRTLELGLTPEAKEAFVSRLICTEVIDKGYKENTHRDAQTHRKDDFSHITCRVQTPDGGAMEIPGNLFYEYVAKVIQNNQNNFARRRNMLTTAADVPKLGRLVRDTEDLAEFDRPLTNAFDERQFRVQVEEAPDIPAGELEYMEFYAEGRTPLAPPRRRVQVNMDESRESLPTTEVEENVNIDMDPAPEQDVMEASIGRTLWICGPPGNGKTLGIVPFVKRYAENTDTEIINVKRQMGSRSMKMHWEKPSNPVGVIYILDDVVDPTSKEGQVEYAEFYDNHIGGTNSTAVVISNFGPEKGYISRFCGVFGSLFSTNRQYTPVPTLLPAFERRSGWTQDGGSMLITTDSKLTFTSHDGKTVVIDEFITSYLAGVIGDTPIIVNEVIPAVMPFTQEEADLWIDLPTGCGAGTVLNSVIQGSSSRIVKMANKLYSLNLEQFDIKVGVNVYKTLLKEIPDVKLKVSVGAVILVGNGKELFVSKAGSSAYTCLFDTTGAPYVSTIHGDIPIRREDYYSFLTKSFIPSDREGVSVFNALSHASSLDPESWTKIEQHFPLAFSEVLSVSNSRVMASIAKQKNIILGTLGAGALVTTFAMVLRYAFSSENDKVEIPVDEMEAGRAGSKIVVKTRGRAKGPNKQPVCSDSDKFDDEQDRNEYDYAYDELKSSDARFDYKGGDMYITKNYQYKGRNKVVKYNTKTKHMEYGIEQDVADAAYIELNTRSSAEEAFVRKLIQNTVLIRAGKNQNYGTMLSAQIGQVPLHTVAGDMEGTVTWLTGADLSSTKTVRLHKIMECPDREVCFFAIVDDEGYAIQGPFKDLYKNLLPMSDISQITRANMLVPNTLRGHDVLMGQFKLEVTINPVLNTDIIQHWTTDIGYLHYGTLNLPTMRGRCGLPYWAELGGKYFLLGTHAVSRPAYSKIGAIVCSTELWRELTAKMEREKPVDTLETMPKDQLDAQLTDYVRAPEFDKISHDDHQTFETYVPKQVLDMKTNITEDMLTPHGPGTVLMAGYDNKRPCDTKASYKNLGIEGMAELFKTEKVPTLTEKEILTTMPERITPDAKNNLHVPYTRLVKNSANTGAPNCSQEIKELAEELADLVVAEMGKETEKLRPLSVQEAISGTHTSPPFKRESAVGGVLGSIFGVSKKVDFVDYNEQTRTITWKGIEGKFIERWTNDQYEFAKKLVRLHIPNTTGLKSEKLLFEKLHKKRLFMITSMPTWLNQKRVMLPCQNIFTKYDATDFTRFPLVFDPTIEANDLCNWMYEGTEVAASFDWESFDLTVDVNLLHGVGYFTKRCYDKLGDAGNQLGNVAITLMQDMAAGSFVLDKAWLRTMGGVESGSGCTSWIDSIVVLQAIFFAVFQIIDRKKLGITHEEIFKKVKTVHGGDDLMMTVARMFAKYIDLGEMCKIIKDKFNMTLTLDTKKEGDMKWRPFSECSFLSRHFIRHPHFPVWISKLKEESVGSILNWSNATSVHQQARQIEAASVEVFPYGEEVYNKYRVNCMRHFKRLNVPVDIPTYAQTSERIGTAIMTKEHPSEFQERFLLESSSVSVKKQLRSPDLKNVVKTKPTPTTTMPYKTLKTAFIKTIRETSDIAELMTTTEFNDMAAYGAYQTLPVATVLLKDKSKVMSVPRNTPSLWSYVKFLSNYGIDMDKLTIASYKSFCEQWEKVDEANCHTKVTKQLKNIYYLLAKDHRFSISELKEWVADNSKPDTLDCAVTKPRGETHHHSCLKCGELYYHTHPMRHPKHAQFPNQCINRECVWYQGDNKDLLKVTSFPVPQDKFAEARWAKELITNTNPLDIEFAVIALFNGTLTNTSELLCRAGLAKPIIEWKNKKRFTPAHKKYIVKLVQEYGREWADCLFPGLVQEKENHKIRGDRAYVTVDYVFHEMGEVAERLKAFVEGQDEPDVMNSSAGGELLPLNPPNSGGSKPGVAATGAGATTSVPSGRATTDITANLTEAGTAEVVQPAAVTTGAAANDTILQTFGGLPVDMLAVGGFVNSLLAYCYNPIPLQTIPVSADTVEYAVLYNWKVDPWDEAAVGPYIYRWAKNHDRFAGGFKIGLQVSTTAVIIGKIGLYYIPAGIALPTVKTRTNMEIFDHTVIDLFSPSSNQIEARPTTEDKWFITRANAKNDWGQVVIMAYTAVSNVIGGSSATAPPVYPTICLTEDAIYSVPLLDDPGHDPINVPPIPPTDVFYVTEGHNQDPLYFPNEIRKPELTEGKYLRPSWMTTSGRVKAEPSQTPGENEMSFYWGSRYIGGPYPYYYQVQAKIGIANENHKRYALEFDSDGSGNAQFAGLVSIFRDATVGRSYNQKNDQGLAGTDQFAQLFEGEVKVETINYLASDFQVWKDSGNAPWYGAFLQSGGTESATPVNIVQFGAAPAELKVRQLTKESTRSKFFEIRAQNLGVQSGANIVKPTTTYLENPAPFTQGPEIPSTDVNRKIPEVSITHAVVCNQSLPTTGGDIPPGYKLIQFWDQKDPDNWFGLPAVLPGVRGLTTTMGKKGAEFKAAVKAYLDRTGTRSYVLKMVSFDSSMAFDVVINKRGAFIFSPDTDYAVIPTLSNYFYSMYLSSDRNQEWVPINKPTEGLFQSRLSITKSHPGFILDTEPPTGEVVVKEPLPKDTMDSGAAGSILGGMLSGIGQGLSGLSDRSFQREMQRNQFAQQTSMQNSYLGAQTRMNNRTNEAREYAAKHAADAQEWSANKAANATVEAARTRVVAGNKVATIQ